VAAQLADCLVGVISQRLRFRQDLNIRVPECEILVPTNPIKAFIRNRDFFRIVSVLETGAEHGMWTLDRYRTWLERKTQWHIPGREADAADAEVIKPDRPTGVPPRPSTPAPARDKPAPAATPKAPGGRIEIEPEESPFGRILKRP
jgi:twitching motility protein PilT